MSYRKCRYCGAYLDPEEKCDCSEKPAVQPAKKKKRSSIKNKNEGVKYNEAKSN